MSLDLQAQLLIAFGFLFILAESIVPAFGLLAIVGAVAFIWGGLLVHHHPEIHTVFLNPASVWAVAVFAIIIAGLIGYLVKREYFKPTTTGQEAMIGDTGQIISWEEKTGQVRINGEIWQARSENKLKLAKGDIISVKGTDELVLIIEKEK